MSFRQTRWQYFASLFRPKPKQRTTVDKAKRSPAKKKKWLYAVPLPGMSGVVLAHTKSEARSEIKKRHGLKVRVPIGAVITEAA